MLLRQMKFFVAVVECQSFSEAAEQCFISQSAISQQIKALEENLEVQLIHRTNRHFSLTPAGIFFYEKSKKIIQEAEDVKLHIQQMSYNKKHSIRIGWLRGYNTSCIFSVIDELLKDDKELNLDVYYGNHDELFEKLKNKELDLVFNTTRSILEEHYFNHEAIFEHPALVVIAKNSELAQQSYIEAVELNNSTCVLIAGQDVAESEKNFYKSLLNFSGNFITTSVIASAVTSVIKNKGFMPNYFGNDAYHFYRDIITLLPVYIKNQPLCIKYSVFWNTEAETPILKHVREQLVHRIQSFLN